MDSHLNNAVLIGVFCLMQAVATLLLKFGGLSPGRWLPCFLAANTITIASVWLLMLLYKSMNANSAMGIVVGLSFVLGQLGLSFFFKSPLSLSQFSGMGLICAGVVLFCK